MGCIVARVSLHDPYSLVLSGSLGCSLGFLSGCPLSGLCVVPVWSCLSGSPGSYGRPCPSYLQIDRSGQSVPHGVAMSGFIIIRTGSQQGSGHGKRARAQQGEKRQIAASHGHTQRARTEARTRPERARGYLPQGPPMKARQRPARALPEAAGRHAAGHTRPHGPPALTRVVRGCARRPHGGAGVEGRWSPPLAYATQF